MFTNVLGEIHPIPIPISISIPIPISISIPIPIPIPIMFLQRTLREIRILLNLEHENIIDIRYWVSQK